MAPTRTTARPANAQQDMPRQAPTGNLPATQQEQKKAPPIVQFRDYVQQRMATLEDALPPTITPKRFVSVVMTALQNKPKLLECTFQSLWNACVRAAQDGLLPDGREGAIAPYGENKDGKRTAEIATWMPMIEGYRKKAFESGHIKSWSVEVVHDKDQFEYELGDNAFIQHKPYFGEGSPGNVVGAYSIAKLSTGETVREVMSAFKIKQVADKSKASNGPWKDAAFFPEMCKKVVARRHYKQLPHSESMDAMIARDDREHGLIDPNDTPPIAPPARTRQLSQRDAFDAYAGETIDNDTGEVFENDNSGVSDADRDAFEQEASSSSGPVAADQRVAANTTSGASKGADAAAAPRASAPNETSSSTTPARDGAQGAASTPSSAAPAKAAPSGTTDASTEAGAGNGTTTASASTAQQDEQLGDEQQLEDGDDRPWPPGTEPTTDPEYKRYLQTELAKQTDASKIGPWWNSAEQKALRAKCEVVANFKPYQDIAVARRNELAKAPVGK
jgi:recombination protein RecT